MGTVPPWPAAVTMLPLKGGVGVRQDSAALCADGRVIYVYVNGNEVFQSHYNDITAFITADNASATAGVPLSSLIKIPGQTYVNPCSCVWRHPTTGDLYLFESHVEIQADSDHQWRSLVFKSASNNGESAPATPDWTLWGTIQDFVSPPPDFFGANVAADRKSIGEPYITGSGRLVLPTPNYVFDELGGSTFSIVQSSCHTSDDSGVTWTLRHAVAYPATSQGGHGTSRNIVLYNGKLWWASSGNVDDPKSAHSSNDGTTWTGFVVPGTDNSVVSAPLTTDGSSLHLLLGGVFYGPSRVESSVDPPVTPAGSRTVLLAGLPGADNGQNSRNILQRVGGHDAYMFDGQILGGLFNPPDTFIDSADIDSENFSATFTFSADQAGSTFECSMDGAPFTPCTSPSEYNGLLAGPHTFQVRATNPEGDTDPTPAVFNFDITPVLKPTRPSLRGRLGCSVNKAHITWRCGFPRLCSLIGVTNIYYSRVLDDISEAQITISIAGTDDICCECLRDIEPWCHELHITRDSQDVWMGPITEITYGYDTVTIKANDILEWLRVRVAELDLPAPQVPTDLTEIAQQIIDVAFADDGDGPCALDYVVSESTGIVLDLIFPAFTENAFEQLDQLSDLGLDFTVVGRSIILGPEDFPVAPIATLKDEHIIGEIELTKNGNLQGNRWFVHWTGDNGLPAVAETDVQCYGRIERLRSEDTALQTLEDATETAQIYVDAAATAPRLIEVPTGSQLAPETPWELREMIPGARVDVSLTKLCVDATQSFRLVGVEVNQDSEGEKVSITLSPVNVLSGDV